MHYSSQLLRKPVLLSVLAQFALALLDHCILSPQSIVKLTGIYTSSNDSPIWSIINGLLDVFPVVIESVVLDAIMSKFVKTSSKCFTRS